MGRGDLHPRANTHLGRREGAGLSDAVSSNSEKLHIDKWCTSNRELAARDKFPVVSHSLRNDYQMKKQSRPHAI